MGSLSFSRIQLNYPVAKHCPQSRAEKSIKYRHCEARIEWSAVELVSYGLKKYFTDLIFDHWNKSEIFDLPIFPQLTVSSNSCILIEARGQEMPTNDKAVCPGFRGSPAHLQEFSSRGSHCYNAIKTNPERASSVILLLSVHVCSYFLLFCCTCRPLI